MLKVKIPYDIDLNGKIISAIYDKSGYFLIKYYLYEYGIFNHKIKTLIYENNHSKYSLKNFNKYIEKFTLPNKMKKYGYLTIENYDEVIKCLSYLKDLNVIVRLSENPKTIMVKQTMNNNENNSAKCNNIKINEILI